MTKEQKELLLKDICARLPYGVKCQFEDTIEIIKGIWFCEDEGWQIDGDKTSTCIHAVKPYLFPLSSMNEEQEKEYLYTCNGYCPYYWTEETYDWLNKNHFDYKGLIPIGLAIDATGLNIY